MKKTIVVFCILFVTAILPGTSVLAVKGPPGVSTGSHNLSSSSPNPGYQTDEPEICVFCHTPHGASSVGPLWNKPLTGGPFLHYTVDTLAVTDLEDQNRITSDQSLLCLSCHDGTASVNTVINLPNTRATPIVTDMNSDTNTPIFPGFMGSPYQPVLDTDLTNDHPISFSYDTAKADLNLTLKLKTVAQAQTSGVRFFGAGNYVECSTCHDPHVNYSASGDPNYTPFLITPNTGSALCLACHIK